VGLIFNVPVNCFCNLCFKNITYEVKRLHEIYKELIRCKSLGLEGVLGTIISTEGSTYQKTGAKCFIASDGHLTGLLSGGCIEGDLKEIAYQIIESGEPQIIHYDFQGEGDLLWGLGLGCNGKMNIFLEPYSPKKGLVKAEQMEKWFKLGKTKMLHSITIIKSEKPSLVGCKWIINPDDYEYETFPLKEIMDDYLDTLDSRPSSSLTRIGESGELQVFYDTIFPAPHISIFGAGPDAVPLVQMAKKLKWHVTVLDHRPAFVNKDNFPDADELVCYPPGKMPEISFNENAYVVIMSHHFLQDQLTLKAVLDSEVAYIGLLGPRKRTDELGKDLGIANHPNTHKIHSPIGLDIGSETPEEIALSIMAEITTVYRGGTGRKLTNLERDIPFLRKEDELLLKM
jgi:xanthine dehydrogenase accessory factor